MLRRDDEPVDPGSRATRNTQALLERDPLIGTSVADFIKASGHECRTDRPDTWLQPDRPPSLFACTAGAVHTGVMDVTFKEDQSRPRKGHGAKNMAVVRHLGINLVRQAEIFPPERKGLRRPRKNPASPKPVSLKLRRKMAGWDTAILTKILAVVPR